MKHKTCNKKNASGFRASASGSRGFTLIEAVVYAAILAVISVLVIGSLMSLIGYFGSLRESRALTNSAVTALERTTREIRLAQAIDESQSLFDASPGRLVLSSLDLSSGLPLTVEFFVESGALMVKEGAAVAQPLTSSQAEVTSFVVRKLVGSSLSKGLRIELEAAAGSQTEKFYASAVLRRSY